MPRTRLRAVGVAALRRARRRRPRRRSGAARWNQQSVTAGELAAEYGFTDIDGTQPDASGRDPIAIPAVRPQGALAGKDT